MSNVRHHKSRILAGPKKLEMLRQVMHFLAVMSWLIAKKIVLFIGAVAITVAKVKMFERRVILRVLKSFEVSQWGRCPGSFSSLAIQQQSGSQANGKSTVRQLGRYLPSLQLRCGSTLVEPLQAERLYSSARVGHLGFHALMPNHSFKRTASPPLKSNVRPQKMQLEGPVVGVEEECERILRTLPKWFGIEEALLEYANNTKRLPTFVARRNGRIIAFLSLEQHFPEAWELNCIAVEANERAKGIGRTLHSHAESWLQTQNAYIIQVKTLAESHRSPEYAETRNFYEGIGYIALEVFPLLWAANLPVLQLVKPLKAAA